MSQITTHILDTSIGQPAAGVIVRFQRPTGEDTWETVSTGVTNDDGRVSDLIPKDATVPKGAYRLLFKVGDYFAYKNRESFYPIVPIIFQVTDDSHYHVPLLLNPFGYSTYRGS